MTQKELKQRINFWKQKQKKTLAEAEKIQLIIEDLQELCTHQYSNGTSAIHDDAHASPYSLPVCHICGKVFGN